MIESVWAKSCEHLTEKDSMTNNIICEPQNMSNNRRFKYVGVQRNMRQEPSKERKPFLSDNKKKRKHTQVIMLT